MEICAQHDSGNRGFNKRHWSLCWGMIIGSAPKILLPCASVGERECHVPEELSRTPRSHTKHRYLPLEQLHSTATLLPAQQDGFSFTHTCTDPVHHGVSLHRAQQHQELQVCLGL